VTPNLETTYLGLRMRSPIVASASPLTGTTETLCELEAAGIRGRAAPRSPSTKRGKKSAKKKSA